ncbi:MAG: hypothetical protein HQM14_10920 [SAR324 cluster bacterium]|nr:hypothetical protein [SAR324 cluster bacterium]
MQPTLLSNLWETHQSTIQKFSNRNAFLALNLPNDPKMIQCDGSVLFQIIQEWMLSHSVEFFFLFLNRQRKELWKEVPVYQDYQELICFQSGSEVLTGCVWKESLCSTSAIQNKLQANLDRPLQTIAKQQNTAVLSSHHPLALDPVHIPKPWGYEAWYTGVEKRGVVQISDTHGSTELPYALSLFHSHYLKNNSSDLILLKTLNPVPQEILGDLYLEMHEKKWEVYLVTDIDHEAWPTGTGIIKAGLNRSKVQWYQEKHGDHWEKAYLKDFESEISIYEKVRRNIDLQLDEEREARGIGLNAPLSPELTEKLQKTISNNERELEKELREKVYEFVGNCEVKVGDVVTFPTHQMHSLQHGIKVIEFQTPHYERLIVMFGQKVLNQNHWDTKKAVSIITPEVYQIPDLEELERTEKFCSQRFVNFPDFTADRITIEPNEEYSDQTGECYHLLIGVSGEGTLHFSANTTPLASPSLQPEKGVFVPVSLQHYTIKNSSTMPLVYLKAMPQF